jgi:hypothetical protein
MIMGSFPPVAPEGKGKKMPPSNITFNGPSKSILIVDDNGVILDLLAVMFE